MYHVSGTVRVCNPAVEHNVAGAGVVQGLYYALILILTSACGSGLRVKPSGL